MNVTADERPLLLSTGPTGRAAVRLAAALVGSFLAAAAICWPFADVDLGGGAPALVAYATAMLVIDVITAVLLLAIQPSRAVLVLSLGYLFTGLAAVPWVLTFPGIFSETGLLGAGLQTTAVVAAGRRIGFPLAILAYALLARSRAGRAREGPRGIAAGIALAIAAVLGLTWIAVAGGDALPRLMADSRNAAAAWNAVPLVSALICVAAALLLIGRRRRSGLDLWLMVVLATQLLEISMLAGMAAGTRFSLGWWAGRAVGFASASVVLVLLMFETMTVYRRLLRAARVAQRQREAQLAGMQALVGAIAHEVNQPLASIVANAGAALRWLARADGIAPGPEGAEARAAIERVAAEAHRAADAIDGIRTLLRGKTRALGRVDMDRLVREVLATAEEELRMAEVAVRLRLAEGLPPVNGDAGQLRQAVSNLVSNAIAVMRTEPRARTLTVETAAETPGAIMLRIGDTGPGVPAEAAEQIFRPFVTTKAGGIGLGLMIARSAVEAHGGTISVRPAVPHGAVFEVVLPAMEAAPAGPALPAGQAGSGPAPAVPAGVQPGAGPGRSDPSIPSYDSANRPVGRTHGQTRERRPGQKP